MIIDTNSIIINTTPIVQYLTSASFGYYKIWSSKSGRNMAGTNSGTLVGIFPKIEMTFGRLTEAQLKIVLGLLNSVTFTVTYYDPEYSASYTMSCYGGDVVFTQKYLDKVESFSASVIANSKRVPSENSI